MHGKQRFTAVAQTRRARTSPPSHTFQATGSWAGNLGVPASCLVSGHPPSGGTGSLNTVHPFLSSAALLASGIEVIHVSKY